MAVCVVYSRFAIMVETISWCAHECGRCREGVCRHCASAASRTSAVNSVNACALGLEDLKLLNTEMGYSRILERCRALCYVNPCPWETIDALSSSTQKVVETIICIWSSLLFAKLFSLKLLALSLSLLTWLVAMFCGPLPSNQFGDFEKSDSFSEELSDDLVSWMCDSRYVSRSLLFSLRRLLSIRLAGGVWRP